MIRSFYILLTAVLLITGCKQSKTMKTMESQPFYVGTYTNGQSEGIYKYGLYEDGRLEMTGLMTKSENPSFLAFDQSRKFMLAVNEISNEQNVGYISSFRIEKDSLILLGQQSSGGAHPCHIAVDKDGYVVTANYTGGNLGLHHINEDGILTELLDVQQHEGKGSHWRQEGPHAHSGWFTRDGNIIAVDLGTNQLWFSEIDKVANKFIPAEVTTFDLEEGAGPRHLAFHPVNNWIYVANELTSSVSLLKVDAETGNYTIAQTISTLPDNFSEENTCADIHISSNGKFLYVSNRGHDSIAIFALDADSGSLTSVGHESTKGNTPRNFTISPDDNFLLVANQNSNNIVSFKIDDSSGALSYVDEIEAPTPVCLVF